MNDLGTPARFEPHPDANDLTIAAAHAAGAAGALRSTYEDARNVSTEAHDHIRTLILVVDDLRDALLDDLTAIAFPEEDPNE